MWFVFQGAIILAVSLPIIEWGLSPPSGRRSRLTRWFSWYEWPALDFERRPALAVIASGAGGIAG